MISQKDLSIVVQGAVCGSGAGKNEYTKEACISVRKYFPQAEIILSTWSGMNTEGIEFDKLVLSENIELQNIIRPDGTVCANTVNHQIITTLKGVKKAAGKYVVKMRSDMIFTGTSCLDYVEKYVLYPSGSDSMWRIFSSRIVSLPTYNHKRGMVFPYNICDWFFIGKKEDILNLFDIPYMQLDKLKIAPGEKYPRVIDNMGAEQYIWVSCLKKNDLPANLYSACSTESQALEKFEKSIACNFVLCSAKCLNIVNIKMPKCSYGAPPALSQGLYTFCEWKRLYNRYGGGKCIFIFNILEDIFYSAALAVRKFVREKHKNIYEKVIAVFRFIRGKSTDHSKFWRKT